MITHFSWTDEAFLADFKNLTFPVEFFNHEAHLRLAFLHLQQYGLETAIANVTQQLKAYVAYLGATDKYHETLTVAAVHVVAHFYRQSDPSDFKMLMEKFPVLKKDFKDLLAKHYSFNIFEHPEAKTQFQSPDLLPFV